MTDSKAQAVYPNIDASIGRVEHVQGTPFVIVPHGCELKTFPELREHPARVQQAVVVTSATSFLNYFNRFANSDSTIFVDIEKAKIHGVIDYHVAQTIDDFDDTVPQYCTHTVTYPCPLTPEAKKWFDNNKVQMNQTDFAQFIEDGLLEIIEPSGSEMLEIASTLQAKNQVNFRSGIRLDNGQAQMTYEESIQGSAGISGNVNIPQKIAIALRIFRGDDAAYRIEANFRYRIKEGKLTMWYELIRPHIAREDAVKQIIETIKNSMKQGDIIEAIV